MQGRPEKSGRAKTGGKKKVKSEASTKPVRAPGEEKEEGQEVPAPVKLVRVVETPVFIPYTKNSALKKMIQEVDHRIGEATNTPSVKFVERCGGSTVMDLLSRSNPWAKEWHCGWKECLPSRGRPMLAFEK